MGVGFREGPGAPAAEQNVPEAVAPRRCDSSSSASPSLLVGQRPRHLLPGTAEGPPRPRARAVFYERRTAWYDSNCDLPAAPYCDIRRYQTWPPAGRRRAVREADVVVLGEPGRRRTGHRRVAPRAHRGPARLLRHRHPQDADRLRPRGRRRLPLRRRAPRSTWCSRSPGPGAGRAAPLGRAPRRRSTAPSIPPCTARPAGRDVPLRSGFLGHARPRPPGGDGRAVHRPGPGPSAARFVFAGPDGGRPTGRRTWRASATSTPGSTPRSTPAATGGST